jgi:predicted unusual protein kinase regulating ubiquinone biosynthesis (AarF/ABC1/UbiB family)
VSDTQFAVIVSLHVLQITLKVVLFLVVLGYLRRAADVLDMAKAYYELGRAQHSDSQALRTVITQRMDQAPAIAQAVEQVPRKTADELEKRLEQKSASESGHKLPVVRPNDPNSPYGG